MLLLRGKSTYPRCSDLRSRLSPRADMAMDKLIRTDRVTLCPHKGTCSYYSVVTPKGVMENVVWSYESPLAGAEKIAGHLAFYPAITLEQKQPS